MMGGFKFSDRIFDGGMIFDELPQFGVGEWIKKVICTIKDGEFEMEKMGCKRLGWESGPALA